MDEKLQLIEAEMAKFESEIADKRSAGLLPQRPVAPPRPNMSLNFLPHALRGAGNAPIAGPGMMPPPIGVAGGPPPMPFPPMMPPMPMAMGMRAPMPLPPRPTCPAPGATAAAHSLISSKPQLKIGPDRVTVPPPSNASVIEAAPTVYSAPGQIGIAAAANSGVTMPKDSSLKKAQEATTKQAMAQMGIAQNDSSDEEETKPGPSAPSTTWTTVKKTTPASTQPKKPTKYVRIAGGEMWEDPSLLEWDPSDYRLFCGDLGNEVSDELLAKTFRKYPSFQKAKVVRNRRNNKSKGYGFVAFRDPEDFIRAMREMNGKYVGNRPIKLKKSTWKERDLNYVRKKFRDKKKMGLL